jgi:NADPH-dependent ferric siderophore reductase
LLEALPEAATAQVHIEAEDAADDIPLPGPAGAVTTWHHRRGSGKFGAALQDAARAAQLADGTRIWVACESGAMRDIRRYLTRERGIPLSQIVTRGYWRLGEVNHPDHDYGED